MSIEPAPAGGAAAGVLTGVLVVGEALIDVVDRDGVRSEHPGGSPMNVAYGLGRLGFPTIFATRFGDDDRGRAIEAHLHGAAVQVIRGRSACRTSTATARIDETGSATYEFAFDWELEPLQFPRTAALHVGSIGAFREPGATVVRQLVDVRPAETFVSFDPNIRPALIPDVERSRELVDWYSSRAHLVKLSDEDAAWLYPGASDDEVLDRLLADGARIAVLTRGAEGSLLRSREASVSIPAAATTVVDTIGAGDGFMTGLIAGALEHGTLSLLAGPASEEVLVGIGTLAATVAAITVSRAGASPPDRREVDAVLRAEAAPDVIR